MSLVTHSEYCINDDYKFSDRSVCTGMGTFTTVTMKTMKLGSYVTKFSSFLQEYTEICNRCFSNDKSFHDSLASGMMSNLGLVLQNFTDERNEKLLL